MNYFSREFNGYTDIMGVCFEDRYSDTTAVQVHDTHTGLDHPGSVMILWPSNDLIAANPNPPLDLKIGVFWIQSECTPFTCVLSNISSDIFGTSRFAAVVFKAFDGYTVSAIADETLTVTSSFVVQDSQIQPSVAVVSVSLGRSILSRRSSDETTLSMQMIVADLGASNEISSIQCRYYDSSTASEAQLLRLPAPSLRNRESIPIRRRKLFFAAAPPSLDFEALEESTSLDIFCELLQLAWILLMLAYRNSDRATKEDGVLLSSESEISPGTNLDLEEVCDDEMISTDGENGSDEAILRNTNFQPSGHELTALHSVLGRHWTSPSKRRRRRSSRIRSRPKYFEPTWA